MAELNLFSIILLLCAGQGIFLALALMTSKTGNSLANRYLGIFTFLLAIAVADIGLSGAVTDSLTLLARSVFWPRDFIYGPALYFYVRELTLPKRYTLLPRQWLHFLPAIVHMAVYWTMPFTHAAVHNAIMTEDFDPTTAIGENLVNIEIVSSILHVALYLWLSVRLLGGHDERIKAAFSNLEKINLRWLRHLLFGVIAVYFIWVFEELISGLVNLEDTFFALLGASMVALIYAMSYLGLRQPLIFTGDTSLISLPEEPTDEHAKKPSLDKYQSSSLSPDLSQGLLEELLLLMEQEKPYLDSQLSLPVLAGELGVSVNYLSQIINEQLDRNFFDFINGYRINEAKRRLQNTAGKNENILTIATESGFNSKSAFYTAFKKHTGMTPGQFRKQPDSSISSPSETDLT